VGIWVILIRIYIHSHSSPFLFRSWSLIPILIGFPFRSGFPFPWSLFTYHDTVDKVFVNRLKLSHADTTFISDINNIYRDVTMHSRRIALKSMPYAKYTTSGNGKVSAVADEPARRISLAQVL